MAAWFSKSASVLSGASALLLVGCLGASREGTDAPPAAGGLASSGSSGESSSGATALGGSGGAAQGGQVGAGQGGLQNEAGAAGIGGAASGGEGGAPPEPVDPTLVIPSAGCTLTPPVDLVQGTMIERHMQVSGTKDVDSTDSNINGPWTMDREYFVRLPLGYDNTRAYPLVIQGPGCGGNGGECCVYPLPDIADQVIKVGLTPPDPNIVGHVEAPGGGCFDDKEGDDSVEWPFYEAVLDTLKAELCYDENRVFASGNSSGGWLANELGCKYAGNTDGYAIRGIAVNTGGLPTDPTRVPTCTDAPMAGMWIFETDDFTGNYVSGHKVPIARAMQVNGCTIGTNYDNASFEDYPIGGDNLDGTCRKILGCPAEYPLITCSLPGNGHGSHDTVVNPGFATFIQSLAAP